MKMTEIKAAAKERDRLRWMKEVEERLPYCETITYTSDARVEYLAGRKTRNSAWWVELEVNGQFHLERLGRGTQRYVDAYMRLIEQRRIGEI
ncbi:hypothetical protein ACFQDN_21265 [Pseudomonas asuensis]|uniref:Uncharacterized protein n=1 Tax=Pseudomonas asuensis TaxID=1825787 RepID=A0ABQ2H505_9PSED|nr:hypothetical protein [Pseudomonas asuensis]GGM32009.1 hypothetical protein GCM10009425_48200 [Pseudomonas asuensis]